jgi:hypothetical protein
MIPRRAASILIFLLFLFDLQGQSTDPEKLAVDYRSFDRLYGLDQNLVNGIRYKPEYPGSEGHPFLDDKQIHTGNIRINNLLYQKVRLGYNIFNQSVILEYLNFAGALEQIILHNESIEEFELGLKKFEKLTYDMTGTAFFQVIEARDLRCLYLWNKSLGRSTTSVSGFYIYSEPKRKFYLWKDGQLHNFNAKKSFVKLFENKHQKQIKQYFKQRHIRLRSISDSQMKELLKYCNELPEG